MKIKQSNGKLNIVDFNEFEAYKVACKIEEDGISFYKNLCSSIKNKLVKEKLEYLLQEEKKHLKFFDGRLSEIGSEDGFEEDDLLKYIDYGIFQPYQDMKEMKDLVEDVVRALDLGILMEDKSIKFYQACRDKVSSSKAKAELENIIDEENRHRVLLEEMLDKFTKK
jgi:rubrerythrin